MTANSSNPVPASASPTAYRLRNGLVAVVAIALSIALFFGLRTGKGEFSLGALAASATPLEVAQSNNKPTLLEFYADWCTTCQAMAEDMGELRQVYGDRVNFVMLNVDNSKWLPEMLKYRVDGIPHFVFADAQGNDLASSIGEQPRSIMAANLEALTVGTPLPYAATTAGQISKFTAPAEPRPNNDDPRAHGS